MILPAIIRKDDLYTMFECLLYETEYTKYFYGARYSYMPEIINDTLTNIQFISVDEIGNIRAFMDFSIDRPRNLCDNFTIIRFDNKPKKKPDSKKKKPRKLNSKDITRKLNDYNFEKDIKDAFMKVFLDFGIRKICARVPFQDAKRLRMIKMMCKRAFETYKHVGTLIDYDVLRDGSFADVAILELDDTEAIIIQNNIDKVI